MNSQSREKYVFNISEWLPLFPLKEVSEEDGYVDI